MAKQVKLKRLQEKNHARQRHLEKNKVCLRGPAVATSLEKKRGKNFQNRVKYLQLSYILLKDEKFANCQLSIEVKRRLYFETLKYHTQLHFVAKIVFSLV